MPSYIPSWRSDLEINLDPHKWFQAFCHSYKGIMNISLIEVNVKILTRWYFFPTRLARIYPDTSPLCYRGCNLLGSMYHRWWTCQHIRGYWNTFFQLLQKVMGVAVPQDPIIAFLNHKQDKTPKHTQAFNFFKAWVCLRLQEPGYV